MMELSTGVSLQPSAIRAELPDTAITRSPTPALTVSTETTYPDSSFPSGEMGFRISSFLPSRRGSFRVATTVPTTRARIMIVLVRLLAGALCLGLADRQDILQALVRARDDMHRDEFAHAARRGCAGVGGGTNRCHVPTNHRGNVARTDLFPADQVHLRGFHHGVGCLDHGNQAACFNHS